MSFKRRLFLETADAIEAFAVTGCNRWKSPPDHSGQQPAELFRIAAKLFSKIKEK